MEICLCLDTSIISVPPDRSTAYWSDTLDAFRQWSTRTFKFTRQVFQERIGQTIKTHDIELEKNIAVRSFLDDYIRKNRVL